MKNSKVIKLKAKNECCGCSACESICAFDAIKMTEDEEGFLYPQINESLCTGCGKCETICPFKSKLSGDILKVFGIKHKQISKRIESRSGEHLSVFQM